MRGAEIPIFMIKEYERQAGSFQVFSSLFFPPFPLIGDKWLTIGIIGYSCSMNASGCLFANQPKSPYQQAIAIQCCFFMPNPWNIQPRPPYCLHIHCVRFWTFNNEIPVDFFADISGFGNMLFKKISLLSSFHLSSPLFRPLLRLWNLPKQRRPRCPSR